MKRNAPRSLTVISGAIALALAGWAIPGTSQERGPDLRPAANPGEVVATELAFARVAREKGQWTAFADYAAKDAVMFVPYKVRAQQWLKGRANPAQTVAWEPYEVWSSCDGSIAVKRHDGSSAPAVTISWAPPPAPTMRSSAVLPAPSVAASMQAESSWQAS